MDPITAVLSAASLAGGIFGSKRKHIDINWLKQKFGAKAVSDETVQLFNHILNSPYGQQIISSASEQGQQFGRNVNQASAAAGLSGGGAGAESGTGIFATSAAQGATDAFQREAKAGMYQTAAPIAQQLVQDRMSAYLQDFQNGGVPTDSAGLWNRIGDAAGVAGSLYSATKKQPTDQTGNTTSQTNTPQAAAPMPGQAPQGQAFMGSDILRKVPQANFQSQYDPLAKLRKPSPWSRLNNAYASFGNVQPMSSGYGMAGR